jgi:hypothetical protein
MIMAMLLLYDRTAFGLKRTTMAPGCLDCCNCMMQYNVRQSERNLTLDRERLEDLSFAVSLESNCSASYQASNILEMSTKVSCLCQRYTGVLASCS